MNLETLNTYIETLVKTSYGRAEEPGELSSGGEERVWCESESKAMELFCMEFSTFVRANPGDLLWGEKPHVVNQKWFSKASSGFFKEEKLYCVVASFEIVPVKEDAAA